MTPLLSLLILVLGAELPRETPYPWAKDVFRCTFDPSNDKDFDGWPDGWTRRRGIGFPRYVHIQIDGQSPPCGGRCIQVDLDGGSAAAYSPAVPASPLSAYVLEGYVRTAGLKHDHAYLSLTFLDMDRKRLQTCTTPGVVSPGGWLKLQLGPVMPDPQTKSIVVGIHLEPKAEAEDLTGSASFGGLWVGRVPRVTLTATTTLPGKQNLGINLFTDPRDIEIAWSASGLDVQGPEIVFQLEDVNGRQLARKAQPLTLRSARQDGENREAAANESSSGSVAAATWKPPIPGQGFYRVAVSLQDSRTKGRPAELTLAVIESRRASLLNEFGWSLPRGDRPLAMVPLSELLCHAGIHWVKYPLWCGDRKGSPRLEPLVAFSDRLNAEGIALVGLLGSPPEAKREEVRTAEDVGGRPATATTSAVQMFALDPKVWYPSLELIQSRLGTQIRWWQLGNDRDMGWIGYTDLAQRIAQVKAMLDRIGQDVHVGMSWTWQQPLPLVTGELPSNVRRANVPVVTAGLTARAASPNTAEAKKSWDFLALSSEGPITDRELADRLAAARGKGIHCWVTIEPLPVGDHTRDVRVGDLVKRMVAAKIHGAEGIFCPDPFDPQRGLVRADGSPGELFLPWRNTALLVGGAEYLGSLNLPGGSSCHVFNRLGQLTIAVWSDQSVEEAAYLGDKIQQLDVWGESTPCKASETPSGSGSAASPPILRSILRVGHLPTFLTDLSEPVVRWQLDSAFGRDRLPSIPDQPHATSLKLKNRFSRMITGRVVVVSPANWLVEPKTVEFRLAPGETLERPLQITLPIDVAMGPNPIRLDSEIRADRTCRFSAVRNIEIGLGDVFIETATRLNPRGELEVEQTLVNQGKGPVSFRCGLLVPDRCRQGSQVLGLQPGRDQKTYRLSDGMALLGKRLWLHAEEIDGPRVLNYPVEAKGGAKGGGRGE